LLPGRGHVNLIIFGPYGLFFSSLVTAFWDPTFMTSDKSHSPEHEEKRNSDEEIALEFFDGINELAVVAEGEERVTWFVWALVACSTISGLLFGEPDQP